MGKPNNKTKPHLLFPFVQQQNHSPNLPILLQLMVNKTTGCLTIQIWGRALGNMVGLELVVVLPDWQISGGETNS